jgi:periplasmic protein TonB
MARDVGAMNRQGSFWIAVIVSVCVHAAVLGGVCLLTLLKTTMSRGDSERDGLPVELIAIAPGTFKKGDQHTPGGDGAPKAPVVKRVPAPTPVPPPVVENPIPKPVEKPPVIEKPTPTPVEKPLPVEKPPIVEKPIPKPAKEPSPNTPNTPPIDTPAPMGRGTSGDSGSGLPGAPGGSRFPIGTPSAGGTVGIRTGIRRAGPNRRPSYPAEARELGIEGIAQIWIRVSPEGTVLEARVHKSSGYKILDDAALKWVRSDKYFPARLDNTPVEGADIQEVRFYLE